MVILAFLDFTCLFEVFEKKSLARWKLIRRECFDTGLSDYSLIVTRILDKGVFPSFS